MIDNSGEWHWRGPRHGLRNWHWHGPIAAFGGIRAMCLGVLLCGNVDVVPNGDLPEVILVVACPGRAFHFAIFMCHFPVTSKVSPTHGGPTLLVLAFPRLGLSLRPENECHDVAAASGHIANTGACLFERLFLGALMIDNSGEWHWRGP